MGRLLFFISICALFTSQLFAQEGALSVAFKCKSLIERNSDGDINRYIDSLVEEYENTGTSGMSSTESLRSMFARYFTQIGIPDQAGPCLKYGRALNVFAEKLKAKGFQIESSANGRYSANAKVTPPKLKERRVTQPHYSVEESNLLTACCICNKKVADEFLKNFPELTSKKEVEHNSLYEEAKTKYSRTVAQSIESIFPKLFYQDSENESAEVRKNKRNNKKFIEKRRAEIEAQTLALLNSSESGRDSKLKYDFILQDRANEKYNSLSTKTGAHTLAIIKILNNPKYKYNREASNKYLAAIGSSSSNETIQRERKWIGRIAEISSQGKAANFPKQIESKSFSENYYETDKFSTMNPLEVIRKIKSETQFFTSEIPSSKFKFTCKDIWNHAKVNCQVPSARPQIDNPYQAKKRDGITYFSKIQNCQNYKNDILKDAGSYTHPVTSGSN